MYKSERSSFSEDNEKPFSFGLQTLKSLKVGGFPTGLLPMLGELGPL